ncbi:MAG: cytochrome c3 family protein [Campylobacterales bacterium]|nr:cytochrome c3 family protein [Campylobacterales bacterium]
MRSKKTLFSIGVFLLLSAMSLIGSEAATPSPAKEIPISAEMKEKFPIKAHHAKLSLKCTDCHENQGDNPENFKLIGDEGCLSCHKSKVYLAERLKFMDTLHVNPHNSIHDGPKLYCDECHFEHQKSDNMCLSCHSNDVKLWMRETP